MKSIISTLFRTPAVFTATLATDAVAAGDVSNRQELPAVIGTGEILNLGTSLTMIVIAIVVVAWLYRRAQGMHGRSDGIIQVLATRPLGPKESVLLVEVGGKQLVLGMTASQIQTLHVLDQPLASPSRAALPSGFAERLRVAIKGVRK